MSRRETLDLAVLFAIAVVLGAWGIAARPLYDTDEARYAEIAREMWVSGDWVVPRLDGIPNVDKPPLLMWLIAPLIGVIGPGELAPRLVPLGASLAMLLMLYFSARRAWGHVAGLSTGAVWATSFLPVSLTHGLSTDMLLCSLTTGSILCFWRALEDGGRRAILGWGLAGLAFLTKGPIGFAIPAMAGAGYAIAYRRFPWRNLRLFVGIPLCLAVAAPWFVAIQIHLPKFYQRFFLNQNVSGFLNSRVHHAGPFYSTILYAVAGIFPWFPLLLPAGLRDRAFWKEPAVRFLLCWAALVVLFFTISVSKLMTYVLPAMPALALVGGALLSRTEGRRADAVPYALFACGCVGTVVFLHSGAVLPTHFRNIRIPNSVLWAAYGLGGCMIGAAILAMLRRPRAAAGTVLVSSFVSLVAALSASREVVDEFRSARGIVERHREVFSASEVVQFRNLEYALLYYLRKPVYLGGVPNEMEWGADQEPSPYMLVRFGGIEEFLRTHPRVVVVATDDDGMLSQKFPGLVKINANEVSGFAVYVKH